MKARGIATAALAAVMLIAGGAAPARAAEGPVVTSTGLTDGQLIGIAGEVSPVVSDDTVRLQVLVNETLVRTTAWPTTAHLRFSTPRKLHGTDAVVTVRAFDAAGVAGEATTTVRVDTEAPMLTFSPASSAVVHGPTIITLTPAVDDIDRMIMFGSGLVELDRKTEAPWTFDRDFTGQWGRVFVEAFDHAGNRSQLFSVTYDVDDAGPRVDTTWLPSFAQPGKNWLGVSLSDVSGVDRMEWWIDGAKRSTETEFTYDFGTRIRLVPLEIRAWDKLGNLSVTSRPVQLDGTGPVISRVTPAENALVRGLRIGSSLSVADPAGLRLVVMDGYEVHPDENGHYSATRTVRRDGRYILSWFAYDRAGNDSESYRTVIVDNTRPRITSVTAPKNGVKVPATVKTRMAATDLNGIHHVELRINGKKVLSDSKAPFYLNLNATRYGKSFVVTFAAVDKAGNTISTSKRTWKR